MELSKITLDIFTQLEHKWLSHCEGKKTRILSIDGGGTKGFISGSALIHLEHQIQTKTGDPHSRISDFFDVFTGTGIGALYATMLTAEDGLGEGRPLFTAKEAVKFMTENSSEMFKLKNVGIIHRRQRICCKSVDKFLKQALFVDGRALTLKDTCKPLLIPCYDMNSSAPFVFSRADALESPSFDFELWKVCRATSATPNVFKPFELTSVDGKTSCLAIDGGVVMNNPTAAAVTHVLHNKRDFPSVNGVEDLLVMSLGNGPLSSSNNIPSGECSMPSLVNIVLDGVSETVDQMLGNAFCWNRTDYMRIQSNNVITEKMESLSMEEVLRERGVESLPFGGKRLVTETNGERIERFVQRLVASGKSSLPPSPVKQMSVSPLVNGR